MFSKVSGSLWSTGALSLPWYSQTEDGEALRDDARFAHVAAWEWRGAGERPIRHREPLAFETVALQTRSYK